LARRMADGYHALLSALADDGEQALVAAHGADRQCYELRDPQAGGVKQFQKALHPESPQPRRASGLITVDGSLFQQAADIVLTEDLRQATPRSRAVDRLGGIVGAHTFGKQIKVELADGGYPPGGRGRGKAASFYIGEIVANVLCPRCFRGRPPCRQERRVVGEVPGVALERVRRRATLGAHHFEEAFYQVPCGVSSRSGHREPVSRSRGVRACRSCR